MTSKLQELGYEIVSGGTDNHMIILDLKKQKVSGAKGEKICELVNIVCNKNTVPRDKSALNPSGIRIGTPAMTSRGFLEKDFEQVAVFIDKAISLAENIQQKTGPKLKDFDAYIAKTDIPELNALKAEVSQFVEQFPVIGQ